MEYKKTAIPTKINISNIVTLLRVENKRPGKRTGEAHDFPELVYVASGENNVIIDGENHLVHQGEAIIFAPLSYHIGSEENGEMTLYIISFDVLSPLPAELYNRTLSLTKKQKAVISEIFATGLELFSIVPPSSEEKGMFFNGKGGDNDLQIIKNNLELLLLSLLENVRLKNYDEPTNEKMSVIEFLRKNLRENLTLEEIAHACSMSTSRLKRMFDGGVISYFNELKISHAKELIRNTDMNISQISEALGFTSLHYFSRLFKAKIGISPSEYKKRQMG